MLEKSRITSFCRPLLKRWTWSITKAHGFGMPKAVQKKRQKRPFLTTAGGMVFGMAGFGAGFAKWPPKGAVSRVAAVLKPAKRVTDGALP
jgi:hypothetical protein